MKQRSSSWGFWLAVICCLGAIGVQYYLTQHHLELQYGKSEGSSICNINQTLDCDSVNSSKYSEVFGTPLALWGVITNLALLLLVLWAKATGFRSGHLNRICFLLATGIAAASVVMLVISFGLLNTFCLFCIIAYILSFGTWLGVYKMTPMELSETRETVSYLFKRGDHGGFSYLIYLLGIPAAVFLFNGMLRSSYGNDFNLVTQESVAQWSVNPQVSMDTTDALHLKSPAAAYKMHIVEFADFNCPHCKHAAPTLHAFAKTRPDVQLSFMNFPLDGTCNPAIKSPGQTCKYAKATLCGNEQGKGWEVHDWLFDNQGKVGEVENLVATLGLDESFKSCIASSAAHEKVLKQAKEGEAAGVRGTPSIFVNGRQLPGGQLMPVLQKAYNSIK